MNQYRCETCDNFSKVKRKISTGRKCPSCNFNLEQEIELPACKGESIGSHITQASIDCGLVCHSDFQNQRVKVLDELGVLISKNSPWNEKDGLSMYAIPVWQLDRWLREFRQAGEP